MAIRPDYVTGTITLTSGSTSFTTSGSALQAAAVKAGDEIITQSGNVLIIASITGQNAGTLMEPCPAAAAGAAQPLRIRYQPDGSRYQGAARDLISRWGVSGNVDALAGLAGENGKLPIFTGAGTMDLVDKTDVGIQDPNGSLGELAGLTLAANKALTTDGSGNAQQSDLGTLGRALLALATGTSAQYVQGDGTLQAKSGLPISNATQTALNAKANLTGAAFTGGVSAAQSIRSYTGFVVGGTGQGRLYFRNDADVEVAQIGVSVITGYGDRVGFYNSQGGAWNFNNNLIVSGSISKGSGTFLIDHPLDPLNKNLRHGFVESPEYVNVYRGEVRLVNGRATVDIDDYFGMTSGTFWALNADITVSSLQNQEGFARVRPEEKMTSGVLNIICEDEHCNDLIAWCVTGRRQDPFVLNVDENCERGTGRFIPEFDKPEFNNDPSN